MQLARQMDYQCEVCGDITAHTMTGDDPGSCRCPACGRVQLLMVPMA